jgi:hypothetical protein
VSETGAELIWADDFAFGFARPLDEQFGGDDVVDATIRLRVLGDDLEFGVRVPEWRQDMVRSLPLNLRVALARLSPEWSPEFDAFFDAESVAHKRFGIECAKNGGVYRCRSGVSTDIIRSYLQQDVEYAAEGSWERHLPDGCSDITEQVPHVPAGARVLVVAEGVLALQYTDGEWWDYHESLGTDDPSTAGARAVGGLTEKIAAQSAQRAVMRAEAAKVDRWIEAHPDATVTVEDALRVRHCRPGVEQWAREHFPGRKEVLVAELAPLAARDERVKLVLAGMAVSAAT